MLEWLLYFLGYWAAGFTLKLGDDMLDELSMPSLALIPLALSGLLFGILMAISEWDLLLLTAIVIGVLASGKVNRPQFAIGFILIGIILLILGVPPVNNWVQWGFLLGVLLAISIIDEVGNDWADKSKDSWAALFFRFRASLKLAVLILSIIWPEMLPTAVGLWLFDIGYEVAAMVLGKSFKQLSDMPKNSIHH